MALLRIFLSSGGMIEATSTDDALAQAEIDFFDSNHEDPNVISNEIRTPEWDKSVTYRPASVGAMEMEPGPPNEP